MTEQTPTSTGAAAPAGTMTDHPISPYDGPPAWTPAQPPYGAPAAPASSGPGFRERIVKLWHALAVAAACLVVGLGFGVLIGHQTGGSGSTGFQPPSTGQGPGGQFGGPGSNGQGSNGFGGPGLGQAPGSQSGQSGSGTAS